MKRPPHSQCSAKPTRSPELIHSQYIALSRRIPLLYAILTVNSIALAATHHNHAPPMLTLIVPAALCVISIVRTIVWRRRDPGSVKVEQAARSLRTTTIITPVLATAFTVWSLALYPYGDAYARCHIAFYMSITVISMVFCLMHLRSAAICVAVIVSVPFTLFFATTGEPMLLAVAMNFAVVMGALVWILLRNYDDFAGLVLSKRELATRHADAERLSDENYRLANLDSLTGLPNRRRFVIEIETALAAAKNTRAYVAVVLFDLDGFKGVNDAHGHGAGDDLLAETGCRLSVFVGPGVFIARLGGDEFGAILTGNLDASAALTFGRMACSALRNLDVNPGVTAGVTASAGIVTYPDGGDTARHLFERADFALYYAKEHHRGQPVMFTAEHETMIRNASRVEYALRNADFESEMSVVFQAIVDVIPELGDHVSCRISGFETLARWDSPTLGLVGPDQFIPVCERIGLINKLTVVLFEKALAHVANWPGPFRVAFNLSARDLASPQTMTVLCALIQYHGIDPGRVELEITETAIMNDIDQALAVLAPLRRLGSRDKVG